MDKEIQLKRHIVDVVTRFEQDQMSITPDLVAVALHPDLLVVTLRGVTSPAEKHLAREQPGRTLLGELYGGLFNSVKQVLEVAIEDVLGDQVERSNMTVEPESGNGVMLFTLAGRLNDEHSGKI